MRPDDPQNRGRRGAPLIPQRHLLTSAEPSERTSRTSEAAANIVRGQISTIYDSTPVDEPATPPEQPAAAPEVKHTDTTYHRTHTDSHSVQADHWKQYHSAWQDYYQQYYERYYLTQVHQATQALQAAPQAAPAASGAPLSKDEALYELRNNLLGKLRRSAEKVRKSRHFIPVAAALSVMAVFLFLQYNRVLFATVEAYVSPGNINPANIIVDPTVEVPVSADPKLIIPKINVDVPVIFDTTPDQTSQLKAMENGVAWFGIPGADSKPGQVGNTVLSGHSSNDVIDRGDYKFIFARLDQMATGDTVYVNYQGKRYSYTVTKKEVVKPTEVGKLVYATDKPILTLITCTPLGTALNRLLVTAEQVSPDPKAAAKAPEGSGQSSNTSSMPGNSPTFVQRLFGG